MFAPLSLLAVLSASPALSWDRHWKLTHVALESLPTLDAAVDVETLQDYLAATGFKGTPADFAQELKLNQNTDFPFSAGESVGSTVPLRRVIEEYSDEPDWGMDQDLFNQYPKLWNENYQYMGGRDGPQSRAFRHMYWPGGFYKPPVPPARLPVHDPTALGEAPQRSKVFYEKSRRAFAQGHPYWGARFLAWSLHYLEDLTQPFHAVQVPSLAYVRGRPDGTVDVEETTRMVAYYHLAMDAYPSRATAGDFGPQIEKRLLAALGGIDVEDPFAGPWDLSGQAANASSKQAPEVGQVAMDFFPPMTPADARDPVGRVSSPQFWDGVRKNQKDHPDTAESYLNLLEEVLKPAGARIRTLVVNAMKPPPPAPPARKTWPKIEQLLQKQLSLDPSVFHRL